MKIREIRFYNPDSHFDQCLVRADNRTPDDLAKIIRFMEDHTQRSRWEFVETETERGE